MSRSSSRDPAPARPVPPVDWTLHDLLPQRLLEASVQGLSLGALGGHALRVAAFAYAVGRIWGLTEEEGDRLRVAAAFHDIGKSLVPRGILLKPGGLEPPERRLVEQHTVRGAELLTRAGRPDLVDAALVALSHHENVDGSGYPYGLPGDCIPLGARIVRIVDVFDALTIARAYHRARPEAEALRLLARGRGKEFDADLHDAFRLALESYPALGERLRWFTGERRHPQLAPSRHTHFDPAATPPRDR